MKRIAIFASGEGTNAANIIRYFKNSEKVNVILVLSDKKGVPVLEKATELGIPAIVFSRTQFYEDDFVLKLLIENKTDLVILAGFLKLMPEKIVRHFQNKIINIHPALLPKYGGKGMFGMKVHHAVFANHEKETGITIHFVNENYDEGQIIFQKKIALQTNETPKEISDKVRKLELEWYPKTIEKLLE